MSSAQDDPTIGRLVADASRDMSALVQTEIALAKSELKSSAISGGLAAALFAAAGFIVLLILILLSITAAYFLTMTGMHPAWAFLIVTGAYFLLGAGMVAFGIYKIKKIKAPTKTIASAKAIPAALRGRHS